MLLQGKKHFLLTVSVVTCATLSVNAQTLSGQRGNRTITTAVPFLTISPDARASGMGDAGVATTPDANSLHWNAAKTAFSERDLETSFSITPWLRNLGVDDIYLAYLSGYKKLNKQDAIGMSLRYFSLGNIVFTDNQGQKVMDYRPNEFALDAQYARMLSEQLSVSLGLRYFHSNLAGNYNNSSDISTQPANSVGVDLGVFYKTELTMPGVSPNQLSFGAVIQNIGPKIAYSNAGDATDFIPTTFRLGTAYTTEIDMYNKFTFALDLNKLLVPSPTDTTLGGVDQGFIQGMFGSFNDAQDGLSEEIEEVMISGGVEYWYNDLFAVRGGYFHESKYKGNRKYFTAGFGVRYQKLGLDFSYLIPAEGQNHPLAETIRISLLFDFSKDPRDMESITE